jgi:hypothetical protein
MRATRALVTQAMLYGVAGFDIAFGREAQDHLLGFLVGDLAFQDAVEDEILRHFVHALVHQQIALLVILDRQIGFERGHLAVAQFLENHVLLQLQTNDVSFRVICNDRHVRGH